MSRPRTHLAIDEELVGTLTELVEGVAIVELTAGARMAADEKGLVHGGFVFGLADYAAMLAVNDPNVVLGRASVAFQKPVCVGDRLRATARVTEESGKKRAVSVEVTRGDVVVFQGEFTCFVLERHVLGEP